MVDGDEGAGEPLDRRSLSDDKERQRAIEDVLRDQARREVLRDVAYRIPHASLRTRVVATVLAAVAILGWFLPIPFLEPRIDFPLPPAEETSGLRLSTYLQAQQVEAFRLSAGRLPDVLREAGKTIPGMTYERIDASTYRLVGATERATVRWISTDSLSALLGDAPKRFPAVAR